MISAQKIAGHPLTVKLFGCQRSHFPFNTSEQNTDRLLGGKMEAFLRIFVLKNVRFELEIYKA